MWVGWHSLPYCLTFLLFDGKHQSRDSKDDVQVQVRKCLALKTLGAESIIGDKVKKQKSQQREIRHGGDKQTMLFLEQDPIPKKQKRNLANRKPVVKDRERRQKKYVAFTRLVKDKVGKLETNVVL